MRTRIALVGIAVGVVLALAVPASAATGVTVGPSRQMIETGQGWAELQVSNPTDESVYLKEDTYAYVSGAWRRAKVGVIATPSAFHLKPHTQRTVTVRVMEQSGAPCALTGVGFSTKVGKTSNGVAVYGTGMAQLLIQGRRGSEAACIEVLRKLQPVAASHGSTFPWWLIVLALAIGLLLYAGKRWHSKRQPRTSYGF